MVILANGGMGLEERLRQAAGVAVRARGERMELVPSNAREAARALAVREGLGPEAAYVDVSLEAFERIAPADPVAGTVQAGARAAVGEVDTALRAWGLTLGPLTPRVRAGTVGAWLEGLHAGLRPVPGHRLETAAIGLSVALRGGGLYVGPVAPRSALGPAVERAFLGSGGQAGVLLEATLRALPRPDVQATVHASVDRPEDIVALLRCALQAEVSLAEAQVQRKARGYLVDLVVASHAFRARRDRGVVEELAKRRGELRTMRRVYERELPFEGELGWDGLASAVAQAGTLGLFRLSRESLVVAADAPVRDAVPLDAAPAPLPAAFLAALSPHIPPEAA